MNSVGLANIKYVRYPSMIKEIESTLKKKVRYILLGSSNAKGLEMVQPKDDIFKPDLLEAFAFIHIQIK